MVRRKSKSNVYKPRDFDNLQKAAVNHWPNDLCNAEREVSIIPRLVETQEKFISLLHVADASPDGWKEVLVRTCGLSPRIFLKHLMVLTDIGGEPLERYKTVLPDIFKDERMRFIWHERPYEYQFKTLRGKTDWSNKDLGVDGKSLMKASDLTDRIEDVAMLLLHGGAAIDEGVPEGLLDKCIVGTLIGRKSELDTFVRQRYIWVSRITGGASANALGHLAEEYVRVQLANLLPKWDFTGKRIPGISQNEGRTNMAFDMVAHGPRGTYCAIEISFQFTTNSTIERKAGQAQARQTVLHRHGHYIAYVIDGAGNFERQSAIDTICKFSDCTVTFEQGEIQKLAEFLLSIDGSRKA